MARDNYFRLLKLSFDPMENNESVINDAIEKQLQFWKESIRKGLNKAKFQEYLSLEDDMRKTMFNPASRKKEAQIAMFIRDEEERAEKNRYDFVSYSEKASTVQINAILAKLSVDNLYDFLNMKASSSEADYGLSLKSQCTALKKRSQDLCEIYRNLGDSYIDKQKLAGYCIDTFSDDENKQKYDEYLKFKVKDTIIDLIESAIKLSSEITSENYNIIMKKTIKSYYNESDVYNFIRIYCERNGYLLKINSPDSQHIEQEAPVKHPPSQAINPKHEHNENDGNQSSRQDNKVNPPKAVKFKIPFLYNLLVWLISISICFRDNMPTDTTLGYLVTILIVLFCLRYKKTKYLAAAERKKTIWAIILTIAYLTVLIGINNDVANTTQQIKNNTSTDEAQQTNDNNTSILRSLDASMTDQEWTEYMLDIHGQDYVDKLIIQGYGSPEEKSATKPTSTINPTPTNKPTVKPEQWTLQDKYKNYNSSLPIEEVEKILEQYYGTWYDYMGGNTLSFDVSTRNDKEYAILYAAIYSDQFEYCFYYIDEPTVTYSDQIYFSDEYKPYNRIFTDEYSNSHSYLYFYNITLEEAYAYGINTASFALQIDHGYDSLSRISNNIISLSFVVINHSDIDIKDITVGLLAWDKNGLAIKRYSDGIGADAYMEMNEISNMQPFPGSDFEYNPVMDIYGEWTKDISRYNYIIISYTDFDGNIYANPKFKEFWWMAGTDLD